MYLLQQIYLTCKWNYRHTTYLFVYFSPSLSQILHSNQLKELDSSMEEIKPEIEFVNKKNYSGKLIVYYLTFSCQKYTMRTINI